MADKAMQAKAQTIRAGFFDKNAFRQKEKLLLVLQTGVAGLHFHVDKSTEYGKDILERLSPGTELMLFRDTDNEHDVWAISVYTQNDEELGYVTRFKNETVARLMDLGKKFVAYVDEPRDIPSDPAERRRTMTPTEDYDLPFSIYMEDK